MTVVQMVIVVRVVIVVAVVVEKLTAVEGNLVEAVVALLRQLVGFQELIRVHVDHDHVEQNWEL